MALTRRQKQIYDFVRDFVEKKGYSPSLEEIGRRFGLSSVATVHKHVSKLVEKGLLRRSRHVNRSIEPVAPPPGSPLASSVPLLGTVAAGAPIEALEEGETLLVPGDMIPSGGRAYALRVRGTSMIDEQIRDGDYVVVDRRDDAANGEVVIALFGDGSATVKRLFRERGQVRLQPANLDMSPLLVRDGDLRIQGVVVGVIRKSP